MHVIGLTGSIGMGKSHAARCFSAFGIPVFDADACVRQIMQSDGAAFPAIIDAFGPEMILNGELNRPKLGALAFSTPAAKQTLEGILHPLVRQFELAFLQQTRRAHAHFAVLDIPLLFETSGDRLTDYTAVVVTKRWLRDARLKRSRGMSEAQIKAVTAHQMADHEKCKRADFIINSSADRGFTHAQIANILAQIANGVRHAGNRS